MNHFSLLNPPPLFVEIGQVVLTAVHENRGVELPLERQADGRLTQPCRERTIMALKDFLKAKSWQPRARAFCAIGARGVSLRRLSLPGGTKEEFHQRLLLQIEAEFPLSPAELAWGCQALGAPRPANGLMAKQALLVAAMKREVLADYQEMLRACGTEPVFTLATLARRNLCGPTPDSFALLDISAGQSELTVFETGVAVNSRMIFWGGENMPRESDASPDGLAQVIKKHLPGTKLFVTGQKISKDFAVRLAAALDHGCQCERLDGPSRGEGSAAISGLQKFAERGEAPPLLLRLEQATGTAASFADLDWKKWGVRTGALVAALLLLPYAEAVLLKPHLAKKVAAFKTSAGRLAVIDRELDFLRNLKQNQPPYIELLSVLSTSVPPGTRFDALSLSSHGEISLRSTFRDGQQVADFRTKLIASGFFANVTVEEQAPTPDRQKVNVRITAQAKALPQLQALAASLSTEEKVKEAKPATLGALPPGVSSAASATRPVARKEPK